MGYALKSLIPLASNRGKPCHRTEIKGRSYYYCEFKEKRRRSIRTLRGARDRPQSSKSGEASRSSHPLPSLILWRLTPPYWRKSWPSRRTITCGSPPTSTISKSAPGAIPNNKPRRKRKPSSATCCPFVDNLERALACRQSTSSAPLQSRLEMTLQQLRRVASPPRHRTGRASLASL